MTLPSDLKLKHLEMVLAIIERMNHNSFLIKGWTLALVSAFVALSFNQNTPRLSLLLLLPIIAFWGLDSYYLSQERLYRKLYDEIADDLRNRLDRVPLFEMGTSRYHSNSSSIIYSVTSKTVLPVYGLLLAVVIIIYLTS